MKKSVLLCITIDERKYNFRGWKKTRGKVKKNNGTQRIKYWLSVNDNIKLPLNWTTK